LRRNFVTAQFKNRHPEFFRPSRLFFASIYFIYFSLGTPFKSLH
jgi:hypothetical protein